MHCLKWRSLFSGLLVAVAASAAPSSGDAVSLEMNLKLRGLETQPRLLIQPGVPATLSQKSQGLEPDLEIVVNSQTRKSKLALDVEVYELIMGEKVLVARPQLESDLRQKAQVHGATDPESGLEWQIRPTVVR